MATSRRALLQGTILLSCAALASACTSAGAPGAATSPPAGATAKPSAPTPALTAAPTAAPTAVPKPTPAPTPKPVTLKAAWVAKTANQMLWPVAKDAGYFDTYGIKFDLNYINGSSTAVAAVFSGDIEMAEMAGSAIVGAQSANQDVIMVAGFLNQAVWRVMAGPDITSIDDLKGKSIAVTRVGNADYFGWQTVIERQHWSQDDLKFVNANDVAGQVGLLQQRSVQAIAVSPPNDVLASKIGAHLVLDTAPFKEPEQNTGVVVTRAYLEQNRAVVTDVVKASIEAIARWKKDATFTKSVIQKYLESDDEQFATVGYEAYSPLWPEAPHPTREGMLKVIEEVAAQNPKAKDLNVDRLIDDSVVKELEASGFIKQVFG